MERDYGGMERSWKGGESWKVGFLKGGEVGGGRKLCC